MAVQEEEMQVQASDMESLTRNMQIREDLIKDLQMQLVDPEHIPAMERLTQEVLLLREKSCFSRITGSGSFQKPKTTIAADAGRSGR
ncbi:myomegalin-like [Camelus dromedarius]|nr:myomegalin-like [Camelus dromedarius]